METAFLNGKNTYFAALNSARGFLSFFSELFSVCRLETLVILKGGPGTGKSTLLHSVVDAAQWAGEEAQLFLCSSDPASLDAVWLPGQKFAVVDGTAPHSVETSLPGVFEKLYDTGAFWQESVLRSHRAELLELSAQKKEHFQSAYRLLYLAGELEAERIGLMQGALDESKLASAAARQFRALVTARKEGAVERMQVSAFGQQGQVVLDSLLQQAKTRVCIEGRGTVGAAYLRALKQLADVSGISYGYSVCPLAPGNLDALYFSSDRTLFYLGAQTGENPCEKRVNMERFLSLSQLRNCRNRLRFLEKALHLLCDKSAESFGKARQAHAQMEKIYSGTMDFCAMTKHWQKQVLHPLLQQKITKPAKD